MKRFISIIMCLTFLLAFVGCDTTDQATRTIPTISATVSNTPTVAPGESNESSTPTLEPTKESNTITVDEQILLEHDGIKIPYL